MTDIRSIEPGKFNEKLAEAVKKSEKFPKEAWIDFVKSGPHKKRPVADPDFWYKRAASILRQLYIHQVVGVERLRSRYGGRKDRGVQPPHFKKSSGKIIRKILQQAEAAGFAEKIKGKRTGRQLTKLGKEFLEEQTQ